MGEKIHIQNDKVVATSKDAGARNTFAKLWFSPWLDAHESWHFGEDISYSTASRRLTYSSFCHVLGMPSNPPPWLLDPTQQDDLPIPLPQQTEELACFVGALIWAGTPGFAAAWIANQTQLLQMMDATRWREVLRWQRTRQMGYLSGQVNHVMTADDLQCIGLAGLHTAIEAQWPGLWGRIRLRFNRERVDQFEMNEALFGAKMSAEDRRHLLGAWRLASHLFSIKK
jgi:hypothetical protein